MGAFLQWHHELDLFSSSPVPCVAECLIPLVYFESAHHQVVVVDFSFVFPTMLSPASVIMNTDMFD